MQWQEFQIDHGDVDDTVRRRRQWLLRRWQWGQRRRRRCRLKVRPKRTKALQTEQ